MLLSKEQFPVVVQAYEITNSQEFFIAEQVVNSQAEADTFVTRYAGKLIKARAVTASESNVSTSTPYRKKGVSTAAIILIILIILLALAAIGYYTGWLQRTLGITT